MLPLSYGTEARGQVQGLASDAFAAQLQLLQTFLPLQAGVIATVSDDCVSIVSRFGSPSDELATQLGQQLLHDVAAQGGGGLSWQVLADSISLKPTINAPGARSIVKLGLPMVSDRTGAMLVGLSAYAMAPVLDSELRGRIALCASGLAQTLALVSQLTTAQRRVLQVQNDASIDALTKVLNRAGWNARIRSLEAHEEVAIAFIDVDFLKFVNDSLGHPAGDQLLELTASTISAQLRPDDCVARLGGDEFAVLLKGITPDQVAGIKERLKAALLSRGISVSFGLAFKSEAGSIPAAMKLADMRMYDEKRQKKSPTGH